MKIIDCFIFYNELEILKARLFELYNIVDYFILVEGTLTFTGNTKPLIYYDNLDQFSKYNDKIVHIVVDDFPITTNPWDREYHQRRCIHRGIEKLALADDDIILISDVDEIPKFDFINKIKQNTISINNMIYSMIMKLYYYTLDWTTNRYWSFPKLLKYNHYNTIKDPELIRNSSGISLESAGWHISYYGDTHFIVNKLRSFSEQQANNSKNTETKYLQTCIDTGNLFFNDEQLIKNVLFDDIPMYFKYK